MTAVAEPAVMPAASKTPRRGTRKAAAGEQPAPPAVSSVLPPVVQLVPVALLDDHPLNPREELTELEDLAQSIAEQGLLQNLTVVPTHVIRGEDLDDGRFTVLIGHRRKAAAAIAKLLEVPCVVRRDVTTGSQALQIMLVENLQRVDISPLSEARAYAQLVDEGMSQRDIADRVGRNQSHISKRLALLRLPDVARDAVLAGEVNLNEAAAIASLADRPEVFEDAWTHLVDYGWEAKRAVAHAVRLADERAAHDAAVAKLVADGARVTDTYLSHWDGGGERAVALAVLTPAVRKKHDGLPCHVAHVAHDGTITWGCDAPKTHRPKGKADTPAASSEAKERALRKALRDTQARRVEALRPVLVPGAMDAKVRDSIVGLALQRLLRDDGTGNDRARLVLALLDVTPEPRAYLPDAAKDVTGWRAQALPTATAIAACEVVLVQSYRSWGPRDEAYLRCVADLGIELTELEHQRCGHKRSSAGAWLAHDGSPW